MTRKTSIDILRIISAIAVVIIHVVSAPIASSNIAVEATLTHNMEMIHTLMNWSVPVFFMITGYCLTKKRECTYKYCFSHVLKYIAVLFTVGLFYALLEEFFNTRAFQFQMIVNSLANVIKGNLWDHMWFVYSIIGVYLVMPVIHKFMQSDEKDILILTGLLFFFTILSDSFADWLSIGVTIPFGGYLFYVCFGGVAARCTIKKGWTYLSYLAGLLSLVWIVAGSGKYDFGYRHLAVCMIAVSIFIFVSKKEIKSHKLIRIFSECTWGIYLLHPFFINLALKVLKIDLLSSFPYIRLLIFAILILLLSFIVTYGLRKIPVIKKLF